MRTAQLGFLHGYLCKTGAAPSFDMWGVHHLGSDIGRPASSVDVQTMSDNRREWLKRQQQQQQQQQPQQQEPARDWSGQAAHNIVSARDLRNNLIGAR